MNRKFIVLLFFSFFLLTSGLGAKVTATELLRFTGTGGTKEAFASLQAGPVADFTCNDSIICIGSSVSFTDLSLNAPTTWNWTFTGGTPNTSTQQNPSVVYSATGSYTVRLVVTNGSGSDSLIKTAYIQVTSPPSITVSSAVGVCDGVPATLTATGLPSGGTYSWQPGTSSSQSISVTPSTTTLYTAYYTNACGTVNDTVSVIVSPVPILTITDAITIGCPTFCTQFLARNSASNVNITSWDWSFGDGESAAIQSPTHCYTNPGNYTVIVSALSTTGCTSTFQAPNLVTVYPSPQAAFTYSPDPVTIVAPAVSFTDNSSGTNKIIKWIWTFGDASDSTSFYENPEHTYTDTGTYCPRLVIVDSKGCVDTTTQCFTVNAVYSFYIPTAFSPNGDGRNDIFMPEGTSFRNYEMFIYDRWGMQLFYTTNILQGWNGGLNNGSKICQEDSYVYVINVTDNHGIAHKYTGALYLIK